MTDDKPARDPEGLAAHQLPAVFVNRAYMYSDGAVVRIVFADQGAPDWPSAMRTAVLMQAPNALEFAKALRGMLAGLEEAIAKTQQAAGTEKKNG
jgi:hypothetical protein